ncbi:hypothetical protein L0U88_00150 [Flavihumibacter sp. RY-1]|uniref:Uncharacterized protein n=1 Tax=Flavihumibacter fluminis TaxID=2909236 RepID=A0ABS9BEC3_9BACT|nr:hypothetical protein [Flavihumibacter fluminis]MCF1713036.1 hypothetical protein [Flavihumibacter fluminis]
MIHQKTIPQTVKGLVASGCVSNYATFSTTYGTHQSESLEEAYIRGHIDGGQEKEAEMFRMAKALFVKGEGYISEFTNGLLEVANKLQITVFKFWLKFEVWDSCKLIIVVKIEDYIDDKIDELYKAAQSLSDDISKNNFVIDYAITYYSEKLNVDRLVSDGFDRFYEHTPIPC